MQLWENLKKFFLLFSQKVHTWNRCRGSQVGVWRRYGGRQENDKVVTAALIEIGGMTRRSRDKSGKNPAGKLPKVEECLPTVAWILSFCRCSERNLNKNWNIDTRCRHQFYSFHENSYWKYWTYFTTWFTKPKYFFNCKGKSVAWWVFSKDFLQ